ncbi:MAG: type II secretion system F family protein [Candidatus Omnitrophica bacterium]|nr:type II secretion system F family protein [Candidatus Omnitrophota bacterium]
MPTYSYKAKDGPGKNVLGSIEAADQSDAIRKISSMGLAPVMVRQENPGTIFRKKIVQTGPADKSEPVSNLFTLFKNKYHQSRQKKIIAFSRYLAGFLKNEVPILTAMKIMADQEADADFRSVLEAVRSALQKGQSFSDSLSAHPRWFPEVYVTMVRSGESGSALEQTLLILSGYLKRSERTRSKISQAMIYPVFLAVAGSLTVLFIMTFVVPRLTVLFDSIGQDLPLLTRMVMTFGKFLQFAWPVIILFAAVCVLAVTRIKAGIGEQKVDRFKMNIPYFGAIILKSDIAKFCRALQMSAANGISFLKSLSMAAPIISLTNIRAAVMQSAADVEKGGRFGNALKKSGELPVFVCDMIAIGEDSGNLESSLEEIADLYEEEVDDKIQTLTTVLEPLMILVIGAFVALIVMSMLLPVFEMDVLR